MGTTRTSGSLYASRSGALGSIEFGHPASNSLNSDLLARLQKEIKTFGEDPSIHTILIQSEGERAFCAGASFDELMAVSTPENSTAFFNGFAGLLNTLRNCPVPVVIRVHGKAVGGGVGLIAACDYALALESASIRLSEIGIGIAPLVIAPAVLRKTGASGLAELSLCPGEWKSAYWAQEKGLFARVFQKRSELDLESENFAAQLARYPRAALSALKRALWEGTAHWEALLPERAAETGRLALSPETQQALKRFKEKNG